MNRQCIGFPLIVGLMMGRTASVSEGLLTAIKGVFSDLRERSPSGVLIIPSDHVEGEEQIAQAAREAGVNCRPIEAGISAETAELLNGGLRAADMELAETSDVLMLISTTTPGGSSAAERDLLAYAYGIERIVIRIDAETGILDGDVPEQIDIDHGWLPGLFAIAGLPPDADLETIKSRMSALANRAAPLTRRRWRWLLLLQGSAALIPLAWLVQPVFRWRIEWIGAATLCSILLLMVIIWWLRWRGMQRTWARARLVAEFTRSLLATAHCPRIPDLRVLTIVPALRPLRWLPHRSARNSSFADWRGSYVHNRVDDQVKYFQNKQNEAEKERKQLSRWTTLLLDIALAFAFAGAAIGFIPRLWLKNLGDVRLEVVLGLAGVVMPVGLLLMQILRGVQELNRRTARFAQQRKILQQARTKLISLNASQAVMEIVEATEQQLLAEVLEWYFHAETAEYFFQIRQTEAGAREFKLRQKDPLPSMQLAQTIVAKSGWAGLFLLRVVLGRVPWIVASAAAIIIWLNYYNWGDISADPKRFADLKKRVVIDWRPWNTTPEKSKNGCVILVHGLYGSLSPDDEKKAWMKNCAEAIDKKLGPKAPNIGCVDWSVSSTPSAFSRLKSGTPLDVLGDISGVRPDARLVGDIVFERLKDLINNGKILKEYPMHLVGHSAGGFVVERLAIKLVDEHLAPTPIHVTILDTPGVDGEVLLDLPRRCCTDFYISSPVGGVADNLLKAGQMLLSAGTALVRADFAEPQMHMKTIAAGKGLGLLAAHQKAYLWFIKTIDDPHAPECEGEGFNRSPILNPVQGCGDQ